VVGVQVREQYGVDALGYAERHARLDPCCAPTRSRRTGSVSGRVDDDGNHATWSDHVTDEEYNAAAPE
jgi:hypothetical protein